MEFFKIRRTIPFMRHAFAFNMVSLITFLLAVFFLATKGLNFSIEFTGGTLIELTYERPANLQTVRDELSKSGFHEAIVQSFGATTDLLVRMPGDDPQLGTKVAQALQQVGGDNPAVVKRVEFVGPQVGEELTHDGLMALGMVVLGIMIYLAIRFEWKFAVAAIFANLHDIVIILGFFAYFQWEFSLTVLAAVLAVLGYSVNESVVVFDRVRETFRDRRYGKMGTA